MTIYITDSILSIKTIKEETLRIRKDNNKTSDEITLISKVSDALSHPVRVKILQYVKEKSIVNSDVCNGDLVNLLDYSQSTISQHVKKMVQADLFTIEKKDKNSIYSINQKTLDRYISFLQSE